MNSLSSFAFYFFVNSGLLLSAAKNKMRRFFCSAGGKSVKREDSDVVCHFHFGVLFIFIRLLFISFGGDVDTTLFKFRALFSAVEPDDELLLLPMLLFPLQLFNVCRCATLVRSATSSGEQTLSYVSFFNAPFN